MSRNEWVMMVHSVTKRLWNLAGITLYFNGNILYDGDIRLLGVKGKL